MTLHQLYLARARERAQLAPVPRHWIDRVPYAAAWFWLGIVPFVAAAILWALT